MNPANFNVGGGLPTGAPAHGQMHKIDNQVMMNYVAQALQAQGTYTGWRAEVPLKDRVVRVYQMFTSLRLIQPQADLQNLAQAALSFEQKAFKDAQQKVDYDKECNDKLLHIRDTRARQAAVIQNGMMPQGGPKAAGMRGVGQPSFPQQMSRAMQANPMAGQQPMAMGMNDPNQVAMQQQRPQQPQSQQQQQALLQQQQQQRAQQRPGGAAALTDDLNGLSPAEYEHVCRVASQIMAKTPHDDVEKIKSNLQNMNPEQRRYLSQKGMDPVAYFFRSQALAQLRRHKRNRIEAARAQNAGVDPNNPMMGEMLNPQQRQMFQNMMGLQRNSAFPMGAQQGLDSSFLGNVENIQGQQADGLRSQEAGQLVVPASSSQINQNLFNGNQQNVFPTNQPMNQGGQANNMGGAAMNPQFFAQQHLQNASNVPHDRAQPTGTPFQPQAQAQNQAQARAQAAQKAQMAISQAGQANTHLQQQQPPMPQQQSPPLSMLNRPMAPGQMSPAQVAAQVRPPSRAPAMGQQPSMGGQQPMQGRPQIPQGLSPAVQEQLAQMTPEQINMFLHQRRAMAANPALVRANANQQSMPMQQNLSQPAQGQPMPNPQNMRALNLQQQLAAGMAAGNTGQPPNPMMPAQQLSSAQQQQQRQEMYKMQLLRQQSGSLEMSMEQSKEMDRLHFPPSILSNNANMVSPVPKHIKTWGHLKQWAATNPQLLGGMDLQKLMALQKFHFTQIMAQSKERNRSADQTAQGNWMPGPGQAQQPQQQQLPPQQQQQQQQPQQSAQQQQSQPMMNPQQVPAGQQPNIMNMRPVTAEDILIARQAGAHHVAHLSDENLRTIIQRNRHKQILHQIAQTRAAQAQALAAQQGQQAQAQQPTPATTAAVGAQSKVDPSSQQQPLHHQQAQPPAQSVPAAPAAKAPAANKGAKGAANKQAGKRKLPAEEASEIQNNNNNNAPTNNTPNHNQKAPAPPGGAVPGGPPRPNMPFTPKQLAAMPPQQRAQIEAHMRRQQGQTRTRAAAEEAWNNLPEKIRQAYHSTLEQAPPPKPQPITPEQKAAMVQQLRDCTDMLGRMDTLVQWFAKIPNQEKNVRSLLAMRIQLMRQFKPTPDWTLNDDLTITPEYLTMTINYVKKLFHAMITRVSQHQNQLPGARPGGPQAVPAGMQQPPNQNNMPALNASNLQQLQQQEEALQRARRASSQTAVSATSAVPPAPFGAPSPQGVPHAYGPGSMPPEQLKLPPMKKRKQSHAGATPTSATPGPKPAVIKPADAKMPAASLGGGAYTCSVPECQHHLQGFPTQAALDKHVEESHKEDAIEDPLAFALDSFRSGLVKPGDHQLESVATTTTIKKDAQPTPATSGTTPMGRMHSQQPPPSQGLTPQVPTSKGPSAPTPTAKGREAKKDGGKPSEPTPSMEMTLKDPWADSAISLESIHDAFVDLGDDGGLGFGAMDEFLNADMFTNTQDTPDSVESAPVTQTPKDGEASRPDDAIGKAVDGPPEDHWIPADWISFPGPFEDEFLLNQPVIDIDWDAVERGDVNDSAVALRAM